jgi:hypothetical protein
MVLIPVPCPRCHTDQVIRGGKTMAGQQRDAISVKTRTVPSIPFCLTLLTKGAYPRSGSKSLI